MALSIYLITLIFAPCNAVANRQLSFTINTNHLIYNGGYYCKSKNSIVINDEMMTKKWQIVRYNKVRQVEHQRNRQDCRRYRGLHRIAPFSKNQTGCYSLRANYETSSKNNVLCKNCWDFFSWYSRCKVFAPLSECRSFDVSEAYQCANNSSNFHA